MNKIRIALGQVVDPNAPKKTKEPKEPKEPKPIKPPKTKTPRYAEKLYTIDEIKRELFGFRLMTDPSEIAEGALIKYIRIDGEDAYKYRRGGFLTINLTTVFHLKSEYGAAWSILTDPSVNIIFYFYLHTAKIVMLGDINYRSKEEIEESGEGVISQITPGKISSIMINSQLGGTIPLEKKDEMIQEIIENGKFNAKFKGLVQKNPNTHKLVKIIENPTQTLEDVKQLKKLDKQTGPKKIKKEKTEIILAPKNKKNETKQKQSKIKQDYSYETSYSLPEYSYSYSDSLSIVRNKAHSIPRRKNN
jgi:hypothetical protein